MKARLVVTVRCGCGLVSKTDKLPSEWNCKGCSWPLAWQTGPNTHTFSRHAQVEHSVSRKALRPTSARKP